MNFDITLIHPTRTTKIENLNNIENIYWNRRFESLRECDWDILSTCILDDKILDLFDNKINWTWYSQIEFLPEQQIEKYKDKLDWMFILIYQNLSDEFIINNYDFLCTHMFHFGYYLNNHKISLKLLTFLKLKGIDGDGTIILKLKGDDIDGI